MVKNTEEKVEDVVVVEAVEEIPIETRTADIEAWKPKTSVGKMVKDRQINKIDEIMDRGYRIMEPEIVDALLPNLESDLLMIGQSKGKFGGGSRRVFRQTQKKTQEGNKPKFATLAVIGNRNGFVGLGFGKSKETVPAREKALLRAKLNIFKIARGCGSWQCNCKTPHSIPFAVEGKCGSVEIKLMPAPKGKGLIVEKELAKILALAGIKDVWSKTKGQVKNKVNSVKALEYALKKLTLTKVNEIQREKLAMKEGAI
jgi:small subunit ribosomal protein S5